MAIITKKVDWATQWGSFPGGGPYGKDDILAIEMAIPADAKLTNDFSRIGFGQFGGTLLEACLSLTAGDFATPIKRSHLTHVVNATEFFSLVGATPPYPGYPQLEAGKTYYLNVKGWAQDMPWGQGGFIDFYPSRG